MDTLSIPSGGGVDTTALIVGDFSNGNEAVIVKDGELAAPAGKPANLVELSVSHYLLARALDSVGLTEADLGGVINTSDADVIAAFATSDVEAVVTWNPLVSSILEDPAATKLFDSADIPGEIIDLLVVNTETLADNPDIGKALVGAWYELMGLMAAGDDEALTAMAEASGTESRATRRSSSRPRCSTTPPMRSRSPKGRICRRPWSTSPSSCSTRASSAKARPRQISSASPTPTARSRATRPS
jgi:NitT/TauT family transport system substrate-binding protein